MWCLYHWLILHFLFSPTTSCTGNKKSLLIYIGPQKQLSSDSSQLECYVWKVYLCDNQSIFTFYTSYCEYGF